MMQELIHTIGRIVARPGRGPLLEAALGDIAREARLEPGNLQFDLYRDTSDDHAFVVEERWADGASMQNHGTTPQARRLAVLIGVLARAPLEVTTLEAIDGGLPAKSGAYA